MSGSMNKVILVGRLGSDPEVKMMSSGDKVANFSLATSETWKDKGGEKQERTEWHRIVIFGKIADVCERYLRKGSLILVEGKLRTRKWQGNDGQDRYMTEVVVSGFDGGMTMLGGSGGGGSSYGDGGGGASPERGMPEGGGGGGSTDDFDDDIPF